MARALFWIAPRRGTLVHRLGRWAIGLLSPFLAAAVQLLLPEPSVAPFVFLYASVALTAAFAGREPGWFALVLSLAIGNVVFLGGLQGVASTPTALAVTGLFLISGGIICHLCSSLREALLHSREVEMALGVSQNRFLAAKEVAGLGITDYDGETGRLDVDQRNRELWGFSPDEPVDVERLLAGVHEDDRSSARAATEHAFDPTGDGEYNHTFRLIGKIDGRERWVTGRGRSTFENGRVRRFIGITQDITDQRMTELALRDSEVKYRLLFQNMNEAVAYQEVLFDERGTAIDFRYVEVNRAFEDLMNLRDVAGRKVTDLLPGFRERLPRMMSIFGRVAMTGQPERLEVLDPWLHKWLSVSLFRTEKPYVVSVFENITDRKWAEETLRDADRRKTEFLGVLSHELRNPLAPIRNSVYVLSRAQPGGEQARRAIAVISRQAEYLSRLIDDLLDVTRIARGKVHLQSERVDLGDLVRRSVEDHRELLENVGIALESRLVPDSLFIDGDPIRVGQMLGNLLTNARKFTPKGGTVTVSLERTGRFGTIKVQDTGVGITADALPKLFRPFVQSDRTLARSQTGLGLGLALVKGLAELHGGSVEAESEGAGRGATFTLRLPLAVGAPDRELAQPPQRNARRILVLEDEADSAFSLKEGLECGGHTVEVARAAPEALEKARAFRPDTILCDIGLKATDGFEFVRKLRADPELESIAAIALSGYTQAEDIARAIHEGFDGHVPKPADFDLLEKEMNSISAHSSTRTPR